MKKLAVFLVVAAIGYFYQESMARASVKDPQSDEQVIRISAKTFEFEPSEITVKKGIPVTLELVSTDRHHGFKLPAFQLRADFCRLRLLAGLRRHPVRFFQRCPRSCCPETARHSG